MADRESQLRRGLQAYWAQDYSQAFRFLPPLAEANGADAQSAVASMYQLGLGVEANGVAAVHWYIKAADAGSALACNNLWCIYSAGSPGVEQDEGEARKWFDEAKRRGFPHLPREFSEEPIE